MSKRKSIVSAFGDFRGEDSASSAPSPASTEESKPKPKRVAAGIVGTTQRTLSEIREERDRLLDQAASCGHVIRLDPEAIDKSPFQDRLPDDDQANFEAFKDSIREEGQKVPITVRRHPSDEHRFQIVYGHRRWRALRELGGEVDAIVTDYSDRDLVIAQGIENANRQDLSWIERALFASEMQAANIKPKDIKAALSIDDAELSKLRSVMKGIPKDIIEVIGRAPSIGRPRWLELAAALKRRADIKRIQKTLSADKVLALSSDDRFLLGLSELKGLLSKQSSEPGQMRLDLGDVGSMTVTPKAIKISVAKEHEQEFARFLETEMEALVERYKQSLERK